MERIELLICCTSDVHGYALSSSDHEPSLANVAKYMKEIRKTYQHVCLIDNGDTIQGTAHMHAFARGNLSTEIHPSVRAMNDLHYDVAVLGNHDFNYGLDFLKKVMHQSHFPWLAANVYELESGQLFAKAYMIRDYADVKVGFIGVTTRMPTWADPYKVKKLSFTDEVEEVSRCVRQIKQNQQVDVVIVSYHGGLNDDPTREGRLAENQGNNILASVADIDVLITGHQHQEIARMQGNTCILQPGVYAQAMGQVKLILSKNKEGILIKEIKTPKMVGMHTGHKSEDYVKEMNPYIQLANGWLDEPLCQLGRKRLIQGQFADMFMQEHDIVQWMHNVQLEQVGAQLSAIALPNARFPGFDAGHISRRNILELVQYPDLLCTLLLTGEQIRDALEVVASAFVSHQHGKIQLHPQVKLYQFTMWEGINFVFDLQQEPGRRVQQLTMVEEVFVPNQTYKVVMSYFLARGTQMYPMFLHAPIVSVSELEWPDLLIRDARKRSQWDVQADHNWHIRTS